MHNMTLLCLMSNILNNCKNVFVLKHKSQLDALEFLS